MSLKAMSIGFLLLAGLAVSTGAARADNINVGGSICHSYDPDEALDIGSLVKGVRNTHPTATRRVLCPVPRSPLTSDLTPAFFWVSGINNIDTTTSCTLYVYSSAGSLVASSSFTATAGSWTKGVFFSGGVIESDDYTTLLCTLPANGAGILYEVISQQ